MLRKKNEKKEQRVIKHNCPIIMVDVASCRERKWQL